MAPDIENATADDPPGGNDWPDRIHSVLGISATDGNRVQVLRNGAEIFPAMLDAIDRAERTVDLVTFVYWEGAIARRFAHALAGAAARGCRVRVLLDAVGARQIHDELLTEMSEAGCDVRWFRPVSGRSIEIGGLNHRTHRKILVCDAHTGFTGGVGIADEWDGDARDEHEWRDTHLRIEGSAVAGLQAGFLDNWADQNDDCFDPSDEPLVAQDHVGHSRMLVVLGSAETGASEMWRLMLSLIECAQHHLTLATAYFNPDERLCQALVEAADRGVWVRILVPGQHADKRFVQLAGEAAYARLIEAGVDIRTYEISMMHAKVVTVDGVVATVGSANANQRSAQFDEEANVVIFDTDVVRVLDEHLRDDLRSSRALDPAEWTERGIIQRAGEKVTEVVSGWL